MLETNLIRSQVSAAVWAARSNTPPIIEALRFLGINGKTISQVVGVSPSMASLWGTGKEPIASVHYLKLIELLRIAYTTAIQELGEIASRSDSSEMERKLAVSRRRVQHARQILQELEQGE